MQSKTKIISAKDYMFREKVKTMKEHIQKTCSEIMKRRILDTPFVDCEPVGKPVYAQVNFGQWVAQCECGGAESVDPDDPIFYCFSCGNYANHGKPRSVIFPSKKDVKQIEEVLLRRPVIIKRGANEIDRILNAEPAIIDKYGVLSRSWVPGETVDNLRRENNESMKGAGHG